MYIVCYHIGLALMISQWAHCPTDDATTTTTSNPNTKEFKLQDLECFRDDESAEIAALLNSFKCLTEDRSIFHLSLLLSVTKCGSESSSAFSELHLQYAFYLSHVIESRKDLSEVETAKTLSNVFDAIDELDKFEPFLRTLDIFSKSTQTVR